MNSFPHFTGGFIGEGDSEDGFRADVVLLNQVADSVCYNTSFARAGSRKDKKWTVQVTHGLLLLRIESG